MVDRPRCLDWTPLATQQLRLRNLIQVIGLNVKCDPEASSVYFTLHSTPMSAPFFRSVDVEAPLPHLEAKAVVWPEINCDKMAKSAAHCVCIRVWERMATEDRVLFVWGVYFSGLVAVVKKSDARYRANTLVFQMHGGQFASADSFDTNYATKVAFPRGLPSFGHHTNTSPKSPDHNNGKLINCDETARLRNSLRQLSTTPNRNLLAIKSSPDLSSFMWNGGSLKSPSSASSLEHWEARSTDSRLLKFRYIQMGFKESDCRPSYSVNKLLQLHERQRRIKYQLEENAELRDRIYTKSAYCMNLEMVTNRNIFLKPQQTKIPGMGKQLSRLLYQQDDPLKPEDILRGQELRRKIEVARFRCKGLRTERIRMKDYIETLNQKLTHVNDTNILLESDTMAGYRNLHRDVEAFPQRSAELERVREALNDVTDQLNARRRTILRELMQIYAVQKCHNGLYVVNEVPLPNAESYRNYSVSPADISVALGFTAHVVMLIARILDVPLRNRIMHEGSASKIEDNIKPIPQRDRIYPLFCTKNPPSNALLYGVYLLNQNIAQIKFYLGLSRGDTRATLANLLDILDGIPSPVKRVTPANATAAESTGSSASMDHLSVSPYTGLISSPIQIADEKSRTRICRSFDGPQSFIPISSSTFKQIAGFSNAKRFGSEPTLHQETQEPGSLNTSNGSSSALILEENDDNEQP